MSGYRFIDLADDGAVAILTLSDPASLNAASLPMVEELLAVFERLPREGARAILLTGAGRGFCSGARLSEDLGVDRPDYDAGAALESHYNPLISAVRALPVPLVTAVNGIAAGIGCAMALAGDIVVAAEGASFVQPFRGIGLAPDSGLAFTLTHAIGRVRAAELLLLGGRLSAATAREWGLVNRVVPSDRLIDEALGVARNLASGPTAALGAARRQCWDALDIGFDEALRRERADQREVGRTADHRKGLAAFLAKRAPRFTGQ